MKSVNIRVLPVLGACVLLLGGAACSHGQGTGGMLEKTVITVDDFPSVDSAGLYIAAQLGLFKQQGLTVNIVPVFTSSQQTVTNIQRGKADISSGDYVTYNKGIAAVIALPNSPTAIEPTRLQRMLNDMIQFGFLPKKDASFQVSSITYSGNLASITGAAASATSTGS